MPDLEKDSDILGHPETTSLVADVDFVLVQKDSDKKTYKINSKYFGAPPSSNYTWIPSFNYPLDEIVEYNGKFWRSIDTPNTGNPPFVGSAFWTVEVQQSSGVSPWAAGIYTGSSVFVFYDVNQDSADPDWHLYFLHDDTRPYNSTDFPTELAAGKWVDMGGDNFPNPLTADLTWEDGGHDFLLQGTNPKVIQTVNADLASAIGILNGRAFLGADGAPTVSQSTGADFEVINDNVTISASLLATLLDVATPANNRGFKIFMNADPAGNLTITHYKGAVIIEKIKIDQATGAIALDGAAGSVGNVIRKTSTGWAWSADLSPYRGTFASAGALATAVPIGNAGDYAFVDAGVGSDVTIYIWDNDDNAWKVGGAGAVLAWSTTVAGIVERSTTAEAQNIVTRAAAGSSDASNSDARTPSEKGLVEILLSFITTAWTWTLKQTFTLAPRFNSVTANQVLEVDASKDLVSAAKGTAYNKDFASDAETIAGAITNKPIQPANLAAYIIDFLGAVHTWALQQTFTIGPIVSDATASLMAGFSAGKKLISIAWATSAEIITGTDATKPINSLQLAGSNYALKSYVDTAVTGLLDLRGGFDASGGAWPTSASPNPGSGVAGAVLKADWWVITVAGTINGLDVHVGDWIAAKIDTPGNTNANWTLVSIDMVIALIADINTGTDNTKYITAAGLQGSKYETQYGLRTFAPSTSAANAYTWNLSPAITTYGSGGLLMKVKFTNANTGAATGNANGLGALNIVMPDGSALPAGAIGANSTKVLQYDGGGVQLVLLNPSVISLGAATASTMAWWDSVKRLTSIAYATVADMITGTDTTKPLTVATVLGYTSLAEIAAAVSAAILNLNFGTQAGACFGVATTISAACSVTVTETNGKILLLKFKVTGTVPITMPSNFFFEQTEQTLGRWAPGTKVFTAVGTTDTEFDISAEKFGSNWRCVSGKYV